eukprot:SAG31_NODE_1988_length_6721_cov_11.339928_2_plen_35_part_00
MSQDDPPKKSLASGLGWAFKSPDEVKHDPDLVFR